MRLQELITEYVGFRQAMGQKFTSCHARLQSFCRAVGGDLDVRDVSAGQVLSFLGSPVTSDWHHKHSALACFYRFAISRGHVSLSPLPTTIPKIPSQFVPYVYTHEEVRRLLDATTSYRTIHLLLEPYTFRAILLLLYGAGLRISEALALTMANVNWKEGVLHIPDTKFYKSRLVPLGTQLQAGMLRFAAARQQAGHPETPDSPFFAGRTGGRLTIHTVQQSFRQLRAHAGVCRSDGARYQPRLHDLRHAAAVNRLVAWYKAGADVQRLLPKLSTYLGHTSLKSTQRYLTMTPMLLQEACRQFEHYAVGGRHE